MLPSRGLRWSSQHIEIGRRRIEALSVRQFSSTVQHGPIRGTATLFAKNNSSVHTVSPRTRYAKTGLLIGSAAAVRSISWTSASWSTPPPPTPAKTTTPQTTDTPAVASSSAASTPATPAPTEAPAASEPASIAAPADVPSEFVPTSLENATEFPVTHLPDTIGYLQSIGIDYSIFRPTGAMTWVIEHIHVYTGTPWWATIAITAVLIRVAFFKIFLNASENGTRMQAIMPLIKPLTTKMTEANANGDTMKVMQIRQDMKEINARAGVKPMKSFLPMLQVFPAMGSFFMLRLMSKIPGSGLETGGMLWFQNLAVADPYFALPLLTAGILHLVLRKGGETGVSTLKPEMQNALMYGLPAISLVFTSWLPAALQFSFLAAGAVSAIQSTLFRQPGFRQFMNMTPLPTRAADAGAVTSTGTGTPSSRNLPRSIKTASPVLSQAQLNSRFEGASTPAPGVRGAIESTKKMMKNGLTAAKGQREQDLKKRERAKADEYERKRSKEIEAQKKLASKKR